MAGGRDEHPSLFLLKTAAPGSLLLDLGPVSELMSDPCQISEDFPRREHTGTKSYDWEENGH
jgi:hypothetical protein